MAKFKTKEQVSRALSDALIDYLDYMLDRPVAAPAAEPAEPTTRLYSLDEVAEMLQKTKGTIRQWVCEGQFGDPVTVGKSTMITQSSYEQYVADHTGPTQKRVARKPKKIPPTMSAEQYKTMRI